MTSYWFLVYILTCFIKQHPILARSFASSPACAQRYTDAVDEYNGFDPACPNYRFNSRGTVNKLTVHYIDYPPYIYESGGSARGVWVGKLAIILVL